MLIDTCHNPSCPAASEALPRGQPSSVATAALPFPEPEASSISERWPGSKSPLSLSFVQASLGTTGSFRRNPDTLFFIFIELGFAVLVALTGDGCDSSSEGLG